MSERLAQQRLTSATAEAIADAEARRKRGGIDMRWVIKEVVIGLIIAAILAAFIAFILA